MTTEYNFDVAVLGGGPGGYPAAIRCAQMGKKVALIEAKEMGGTCLNRGCIPSKILIANAEVLKRVREAEEFGIHVQDVSFDFGKMVARKDRIVSKTRSGLEGLIKANKIELIRGFGKLVSPNQILVSGETQRTVHAGKIIVATGSEPKAIGAFPFDYKKIHDSTSLLELQSLPKSLVIIGGGIIGCEFASLYNVLGVDVTIVEMLPSIIPMESQHVSSFLTKTFKKKGIKIHTNALVQSVKHNSHGGVTIELAGKEALEADIALVATGRSLNTKGIGLEDIGVKIGESGIVMVNEKMETNIPGVYAIGDIASKWWLAHVASHQGLVAAKNACGEDAHMNYNAIPSVIFTEPEIGTIGLTLEAATAQGFDATIGAFPFQGLGKAQATHHTEGFAQVIIDKPTGQILGAQVVGHEASTLIAEMAVAVANELTLESITETIHAHPTIAESWLEAAFIAAETPLHLPPK